MRLRRLIDGELLELGEYAERFPEFTSELPQLFAALEVLAFEANLVAIAAGNLALGVILTDADRARVMTATGRINRVVGDFA